ncbi:MULTISPECIES: helix-turn-helix transcriptional regulator [Lachnoanaerobaculum]|jgi:possible transcriptional regulator|uniref:YheO-like protein n=1 Tax=Lachnoanaerobaculum saburreum TaxID=467210 RepID=A0A133ZAV7_9FIRM|nr:MULTISPECIES: helix-turn-helix transcriptional regulator [Lachnoanaerobaculum]EHO49450.1 YheO-like protein [Lachnospiraceae bacterium oral taxon 082 str. F0431]KXB52569.1 YheO-like protein [Lachnoanaerobaculum saburreum]MBS6728342.1 transcriptional regulator [Lachnospiraceae bacterium oral taxon 082]
MNRDDLTLESLVMIAHGIARQFGNDCEVCIHDLQANDLEHTICYIINGHVSGRKIGDGASKIVLETLEALKKGDNVSDHLGYRTHTSDGRILKSSTIFLKDESGKYRFILGINHDMTNFINAQSALSNVVENIETTGEDIYGQIPLSVNDLLDNLIEQSVKLVGKTPALMTKDEKVKAIKFLQDAGAFLITRSGDKISQFFGISKFTLYSYIDQAKAVDE